MRKQSGFTLIELAIVLVIIGLLLGFVLRGQSLIDNAKAKSIIADFKNAQIFIYGYQDKFKAIPGDDAHANSHIKDAKVATGGTAGNGIIEGAWNDGFDKIDNETVRFWEHIRLAGFATGPKTIASNADLPVNAENGRVGVQSTGTSLDATITGGMTGSYVACSDRITGSIAKQVDVNLDDGETNTGSVRAVVSGTASAGVKASDVVDADPYTVCMSF
jgi:prepilin-type N-terminal cleavage/methylation domain-containing protein